MSLDLNWIKIPDVADKIIVACSGGVDSMVLIDLLQRDGFTIEVAHFNHKTRSGQSDQDENFVISFCAKQNIKCHTAKMDYTQKFNNFHNEAHRQRYNFFKTLRGQHILTAHHQDDQIETIFFNIIKGRSATGMASLINSVQRPMLHISKKEILAYAKEHNLKYVEDVTNAEINYERNFIRHKVLPLLQERDADFKKKILGLANRINLDISLLEDIADKLLKPIGVTFQINLKEVEKISTKSRPTLLYYALNKFGFNRDQCSQIYNTVTSGKIFKSDSHALLKHQDKLIIRRLDTFHTFSPIVIDKNFIGDITFGSYRLSFELKENATNKHANICFIPTILINDKIVLRTWKKGDTFKPLGMQGKSQTLKKFFANNKINVWKKSEIPLLCIGNRIAWIVGMRLDHDFNSDIHNGPYLSITLD